ncbi:hypothetical protein JAAARDRAFT_123095 [Jaapia argillacea MUCL 33604]|uniref:Phosphatidic acid phosphatase type 2/haloperoxidase domain-containing protein n=1 Tax=Jaapia argillacea MUCL 33604 TaxID=933084 RepID=A0A067QFZ8_9AGAM|nr:hypothetical protein JAAARDRAFT_123095 [Jaapia argillacea MUCL 33604]
MNTTDLQRKIKEIFGHDSLDWLDRSYIFDWVVAACFWGLSGFVGHLPVYERQFTTQDSLISHPHVSQQISGVVNHTIALYIPFAFVGVVGVLRRSVLNIHHGVLAVWAGCGLGRLITEFLKYKVGRLRPDFLSRCRWDEVVQACTGKASDILDGRKSFPSGHSSTAFAGMTFLALFLAGQTAAWCFSAPIPQSSWLGSRLSRFAVTLAPLFWATWVAISRLEDYRHHKEDIIVGSLIGIMSSCICFHIYWPSPFSARSFVTEYAGHARMVYGSADDGRLRNDGFELTGLQDETDNV